MKVGDLVMFNNFSSRYAKWFFGRFATVESADHNTHCRVRWITPVKYHNGFSTISDFKKSDFEVCK